MPDSAFGANTFRRFLSLNLQFCILSRTGRRNEAQEVANVLREKADPYRVDKHRPWYLASPWVRRLHDAHDFRALRKASTLLKDLLEADRELDLESGGRKLTWVELLWVYQILEDAACGLERTEESTHWRQIKHDLSRKMQAEAKQDCSIIDAFINVRQWLDAGPRQFLSTNGD